MHRIGEKRRKVQEESARKWKKSDVGLAYGDAMSATATATAMATRLDTEDGRDVSTSEELT